ncbi:MAG: 2-C-methyl-D-erythritol 2,4-cyclodiphosphate synthase [Deltaproteobacteria bacterium]|nr:2-C-methyl-D-erythritol 2,4-cyclodiphosphate synthase [Deltaproteobacteria bacterium]
MKFHTGIGYDVHKLVRGRDCIIGGVKFDHTHGLLGHSDADVLLHAVCDALLGALALGDIGDHFPDRDPRYKNIDSRILLKKTYQMILDRGYVLNNLDTIIVCEDPKIKPRRQEIISTLAEILAADKTQISVKATTEEHMGFTGRCEGIKAWAYVSIVEK